MSRVAAALLAWAGAVAAQQDAQQVEAQVRDLVEQGRERLWAGGQAAAARERFVAALALPGTWSTPFAELGLATLARLEGNLPEALDRLAKVRRRTAAWPMGEELPRLVRFDLHIEAGLCNLAMGLGDRAGAEFAAAAEFSAGPGAARALALELARCDLYLATSDLRAARRSAASLQLLMDSSRWLPAEAGLRARQHEEVRLRGLLLRRRLARRPEEFALVAADLAEEFLSADIAGFHRTRLGSEAVTAFVGAGDLDAALVISKQLCEPPFESLQRHVEVQALHLALLLRAGVGDAEVEAGYVELKRIAEELFASWRAVPLRPGGVGTFHYQARREVLGTLLTADRALAPDQPRLALSHLEAALSLGTLTRRLQPASVDVGAVELAADSGALVFVLAPGCAHWFVLDSGGIEHVRVPLEIEDEDRLAEFVRGINRPPLGDPEEDRRAIEGLGAALASRLFPPNLQVRARGWRSVLLVGDEAVVPALQALPLDGVPLGIAKSVCHVPSLSLYVALQARSAARERPVSSVDLVLFADPELTPEVTGSWQVQDLLLRPEQLDRLATGWPADRVRRLVRGGASVSALRDREFASARQLTIVAHGVEDLSAERAAAVTVAGDGTSGLLRADVVEALQVPPLVVLAVCGAAGGPVRLGDDGVHHLGGAFVLAGADRVVLAGGQLAVGATIELVGDLTRGVARGAGPAEALRAARAAVQATKGREHPYYWAGLRLLGLPDTGVSAAKR